MFKKTVLLLTFASLMAMSANAQHVAVNGVVNDTLLLNEVVINSSYADNKTPLTTSEMSRKQLEEIRLLPSLPYQLELEPSVVVSGENGMVGATSFRIRGVDATRINVNINGITLNDPESQSVFWYNIPNLGGMAQNIQLQRGVGASNGGSAAMGGAMNLQTFAVAPKPYAQADLSYGSFNTAQYGLTFGTGITPSGFAFDMAINGLNSDGFIRNGKSNQTSVFLNGGWYGKRSLFKAVFIMGMQHTGITWDGASAEDLDLDPTYNGVGAYYDEFGNVHYYDNETDNYQQEHLQLYYSFRPNTHWTLNAAFDYTRGDGYYEQYKDNKKPGSYYGLTSLSGTSKSDFIHRKMMDNDGYTGILSAAYQTEKFSATLGNTYLYYNGWHFGNLIWAQDELSLDGTNPLEINEEQPYEWYRNRGQKHDNTAFLKLNYDFSKRFNMYGNLQVRFIDYTLSGMDDSFDSIPYHENYLFINPKLGANFQINPENRLYFVAGMTNREPTRSDIKDAIENGEIVKPETMLDLELGYGLQKADFTLQGNLYAMLYKDQLTPSGDLSSTGYALMENVDKSYRIGLELVAGYRFTHWFSLDGNLTLSQNKILDYTFTDFNDGDSIMTTYTKTTDLSFSPSVVGAAIATFKPFNGAKLQIIGKYVGKQYCDNTSREVYALDPYFLLNMRASYTWQMKNGSHVDFHLAVNNLTNHQYRLNAWVGDWVDDYSSTTTNYYYHSRAYLQQPGINFMAGVTVGF
ncbi:MAG: TonB-dependent receptor plug domain-containing protein [Bacteroidales bacterium]|nr:TonB-dependent receptor plug domain-containing protein [Bacteroidales bacterium]